MVHDATYDADDPSQFYTGLVSHLYEPLAGGLGKAGDYTGFIDRAGQPVLEICCGAGSPMLDLVRAGYDVEGLDASADMLARFREKAAAAGFRQKNRKKRQAKGPSVLIASCFRCQSRSAGQ